tara:strand:- start:9136 stop:9246 length:111 start_codon:yes stop_codon:yes gene_type:complete
MNFSEFALAPILCVGLFVVIFGLFAASGGLLTLAGF